MLFRIRHITHYKYAQRVTRCYNLANVVPRNTEHQTCLKTLVTFSPQPAMARQRTDYFDNQTYNFEIQKPHTELIITAVSDVRINNEARELNLDLGISYGDALTRTRAYAGSFGGQPDPRYDPRERAAD